MGVQGAGKSHTLGCIIENCMLTIKTPAGVIKLQKPMTTLVFHFDQCPANVCEATGLINDSPAVRPLLERMVASISQKEADDDTHGEVPFGDRFIPSMSMPRLDREKMVVLVSPSNYHQRKKYYGGYCIVKPLLFSWRTLTAKQIKVLMRINPEDSQLYVSMMLDLLRRYQRENLVPEFSDFLEKVESQCSSTQGGPLKQRKALLESIVYESSLNESLREFGGDLESCMKEGMLVVVDLTDPFLSSDEANGIFQVLLEQFRSMQLGSGGKLVALDEAHKFMSSSSSASGSDGLSDSIVDTVRLMRHEGIRVAISTQNPMVLAPELLELVTVAVVHRFHSSDWFSYLSKKIPLVSGDQGSEDVKASIRALPSGHAFVFAVSNNLQGIEKESATVQIAIRPRFTADRGASRVNASKKR